MTQDQQNKSTIQQRTTDKSAIRAIQNELPPEPVCYNFIQKSSDFREFKFQDIVLPESIIPQEFRLIKNVGVTPIDVYDE